MWVVYSTIQYEGDTFHGIFNSLEDANKAVNKLESDNYDCQGIYAVFCDVGTIMIGFENKY